MKTPSLFTTLLAAVLLAACTAESPDVELGVPDFSAVSRVDAGRPVAVMLTAYSTTLLADGKDGTRLRIAVADSLGREITSAADTIRIYVEGDGRLTSMDGEALPTATDTAGAEFTPVHLVDGRANVAFVAGTTPGQIDVRATSGTLFDGGHQIHTIPRDVALLTPTADQLPDAPVEVASMIGADISWLPQIEAGSGWFSQGPGAFFQAGEEVDAFDLLRDHGFNNIRLRVFHTPDNPEGYSPEEGYCGLDPTLTMARRIEDAGMDFLLDFHYSDDWADPQQQNKPLAWKDLDYPTLQDSVRAYTASVLRDLGAQGTLPDMVQIGNEINHGLLWPDGHIGRLDGLAGLLRAGVEGTREVAPDMPVMMHIALGGQNAEARFWLDNMLARGVEFDVLGLSYYPRWHGTLEDLYANVHDLASGYHKPIVIVEYSDFKREVADIVFGLPDDLGKGTAIWEPLTPRSGLFDTDWNATDGFRVYEDLAVEYLGWTPPGG